MQFKEGRFGNLGSISKMMIKLMIIKTYFPPQNQFLILTSMTDSGSYFHRQRKNDIKALLI